MVRRERFSAVARLSACCVALCGCTLGPRALQETRIPYNEVIQRTAHEQLLLNLVRARYRENPAFVQVGSVAAQFEIGSAAAITGTLNENVGEFPNNPDVLELGADVRFQERPTVTYTPLQGADFVTRLLTPLKLETVILLTRSGWSVDRVFRLTIQQINALDNAGAASGPTPDEAPQFERFARVTKLLRELQKRRLLVIGYEQRPIHLSDPMPAEAVSPEDVLAAARDGLRFETTADGKAVLVGKSEVLVWHIPPVIADLPEVREIVELLNLEPGHDQYEIRLAAAGREDEAGQGQPRRHIDVTTRSIMGTLFYVSHAVEVPPRHQKRGLVTTTRDAEGRPFAWTCVTGDLLRVHHSLAPPKNAAVAVRYAGHWFYIDNADLQSKSTLALLGQIFSLQAGAEAGVAPVLTLPIGG